MYDWHVAEDKEPIELSKPSSITKTNLTKTNSPYTTDVSDIQNFKTRLTGTKPPAQAPTEKCKVTHKMKAFEYATLSVQTPNNLLLQSKTIE